MDGNAKSWQLGKTFFGPSRAIPSDFGHSIKREGDIRVFKVKDINDQTNLINGADLVCIAVRNTSGAALLPGRLVTWQSLFRKRRVDGYARLTATEVAGVVDPYLPSVGVRANDLFWLAVKGPCYLLTDLAGGANNLLPADTSLVALTAATSGATTAGRVAPQDLTGATAVLGAQLQNRIGVAMSARTTANTNAQILVDLTLPWV